jgi:amino-acid N-acetyltransferase
MTMTAREEFVQWFRNSSPYINAHRGKIFVVSFGGETVADGRFASLAQDCALLHGLGIHLVLVHGVRPQVEQRLKSRGIELRYHQGLRLTDAPALACVKEAVGAVRVEIEALLSMGLAHSPMAGARIRVTSGNFVIAKPVGVRDGVDYGHTGEVRRVDADSIRQHLHQGNVVLLSPLGYSPTGEVFNLSAEEVATATAVALRANKLLLMMDEPLRRLTDGVPIPQITSEEARTAVTRGDLFKPEWVPHVLAACDACTAGVERAHLLDRHVDGAILLELYTRDGIGTLVSETPYEEMRTATIHDVGGILDLIAPLQQSGVLVTRSRERLEMDIEDYLVIDRDGLIIGCAALHVYPEDKSGELACLAVHPSYRSERRGERLLAAVEERAVAAPLEVIFALTTRSMHWFLEHGFEQSSLEALPAERRPTYSQTRNSKILVKNLTPTTRTAHAAVA